MENRNEILGDAVEYITAQGTADYLEAAKTWRRGPEAVTAEAVASGWTPAGDWRPVWNSVLVGVALRFYREDSPWIIAHRTGERIRTAVPIECLRYLRKVEDPEGVVSGRWYDVDGPIYIG